MNHQDRPWREPCVGDISILQVPLHEYTELESSGALLQADGFSISMFFRWTNRPRGVAFIQCLGPEHGESDGCEARRAKTIPIFSLP
jgi:hypothetical protein